MSSCKFVNGEVIIAVAENCPKLKGTQMIKNFNSCMIRIYFYVSLFRFSNFPKDILIVSYAMHFNIVQAKFDRKSSFILKGKNDS